MTGYTLERKLTLPAPPTEVFEFFRDPLNLVPLVPPRLKLRLVEPFPKSLGRGTLVEYRFGLLGFRLRWVVLTTVCDAPRTIQDEQVRGPFAAWTATQEFRRVRDGTEITDSIRYVMRLGFIGRLLHLMFVRRNLEHIFAYRCDRIHSAFVRPATKGQPEKTKSQ